MADIPLRLVKDDDPPKFGVLIHFDGVTQTDIAYLSEQEILDLHRSPNGVPPGITREEWETHDKADPRIGYHVIGHPMDVGDVVTVKDGKWSVLLEHAIESGVFTRKLLPLDPPPSGKLAQVSLTKQELEAKGATGIDSITNGVLRIL